MNNILLKKYDSEDEDDEDFVPSENEEEDDHKKQSRGLNEKAKLKVIEIWNEMKLISQEDIKKPSKIDEEDISLDKVKNLLEKVRKHQPKPQIIKFAGKTFDLGENNEYKLVEKNETEVEKVTEEKIEVAKEVENFQKIISFREKNEYLRSFLKIIEAKNINSMTKSRYDWKEYASKTNQEKNFSENRKDGYLEKKKFLEKSKQDEKEFNRSKKRTKV